jgi:RNA polymerase sigma factor (TIGR02999 family)
MVKNDGSVYLISPILVWANVLGSPSSLVVIEWPSQFLAESWPIDPLHRRIESDLMASSPDEVTLMLIRWSNGERDALDKLIPLVYGELRQLASRALRRERRDHTLQPTALVHEAYLRLIDQRNVNWQNRAHFFAIASQAMRRIIVDHARRHNALKRGGDNLKVELEAALMLPGTKDVDVVRLDDALTALGSFDPQQSRIVELRFFGGLSIEETAEVIGISPATVKRDWSMAKAWLHREMQNDGGTAAGGEE